MHCTQCKGIMLNDNGCQNCYNMPICDNCAFPHAKFCDSTPAKRLRNALIACDTGEYIIKNNCIYGVFILMNVHTNRKLKYYLESPYSNLSNCPTCINESYFDEFINYTMISSNNKLYICNECNNIKFCMICKLNENSCKERLWQRMIKYWQLPFMNNLIGDVKGYILRILTQIIHENVVY